MDSINKTKGKTIYSSMSTSDLHSRSGRSTATPIIDNIISMLPTQHDSKALKYAVYNVIGKVNY